MSTQRHARQWSFVAGLLILLSLALAAGMNARAASPAAGAPGLGCTWRDNFAGPALSSRWGWLRENATHWSLTERPGFLRLMPQAGSLLGEANSARNLLLQDAPAGDFEIQTRLIFTPPHSFQSAGLLVYQDDDNYLMLGRAFCGAGPPLCVGDGIYFDHEQAGVTIGPNFATALPPADIVHLRLTRRGRTIAGYVSLGGDDWMLIGEHLLGAGFGQARVGLITQRGSQSAGEAPADFDFFSATCAGCCPRMPLLLKGFSPPADVIFYGGTVLTLEDDMPVAGAIAIAGERILAVGSDAGVLALRGPATQVVDLAGRALLPGFVDPHSHLLNAASQWGLDLDGAQRLALENGVTTLGSAYTEPALVAQMQQLEAAGRLRLRVNLYLNYTTSSGGVLGDWYRQYPPARRPGQMLRIAGVKIFTDGGSCGCPAYSFEHPTCGYGNLWLTQDQLNTAVAAAQAAGYQVAIHALGDRAVEQALDAIQSALAGQPNALRHRIEHNAVVRDDMLARYAQVNPVALIFGAYPCAGINFPLPPAYRPWEWRWRDLLAAHPAGHFAWHSDAPVTPVSPLLNLYSMTTAHQVSADGTVCELPAWLSAKTLTVAQALPLMTRDAAYALRRDDELGSLRAGKLADLVVLSADPLAGPPEAIKDIQVLMTMVGGKVEYCRSGNPSPCTMEPSDRQMGNTSRGRRSR